MTIASLDETKSSGEEGLRSSEAVERDSKEDEAPPMAPKARKEVISAWVSPRMPVILSRS